MCFLRVLNISGLGLDLSKWRFFIPDLLNLGGLVIHRRSKCPLQIYTWYCWFYFGRHSHWIWGNVKKFTRHFINFYLRVFSFLDTAWNRGKFVWSLESERPRLWISAPLLINLVISGKLLNSPILQLPRLYKTPLCSWYIGQQYIILLEFLKLNNITEYIKLDIYRMHF